MGNHMPHGITQCYLPPCSGDFPAFTPAEAAVVLKATPEGCKAELTYVVITYPKIVYLPKTVTCLRNNQAVSWPWLEPAMGMSQVQRPNHYTTEPQMLQ